MPSDLLRVARRLVECLDQVPGVVDHLQRTATRCRENAAVVIAVSGGRATTAAQQLDAAARACDEAAHYLSMAPPRTRAWAERLIGTPSDGGRQDGSGVVGGGNAPEPPSVGREVPERPNPAPFLEHIFRRLPERPGGRGPTSGVLTRTDGRGPIHLVSGLRGPGRGSPGLAGDYARLSVAQGHVEGHAAALMRRLGAPKEATLYLNNQPCGGEYGCDETLEAQLPRGAKLTIFWPGDHKVYRGTGEGMA